jgi:hypothetical protein
MLGVWAKASILRYAISAEMRVSLIFFVSAPFVTEADKAKADRHSEHNPDVRIVQIGPQQGRGQGARNERHSGHRERADLHDYASACRSNSPATYERAFGRDGLRPGRRRAGGMWNARLIVRIINIFNIFSSHASLAITRKPVNGRFKAPPTVVPGRSRPNWAVHVMSGLPPMATGCGHPSSA